MKKKNVIVCGKSKLAVKIAEWFLDNPEYNLIYVIPVVPEPKWANSLKMWSKKKKIACIDSGNYSDLSFYLKPNLEIDLLVSVFYEKIFKEDFIKKCKKIINIHNAPLPKYRGVSPINWALKNKERKHGVTIHEITPGIDDGPIISQIEYSIFPEFDEVEDVYKRSLEYAWILFTQTIPLIDKIYPREQDHKKATLYTKKEDALLGEVKKFSGKKL